MSTPLAPNNDEKDSFISTLLKEQQLDKSELSGPSCEKCGAPISVNDSLACRQCGWYESIGSYVEIDQSWEAATDAQSAGVSSADETRIPKWAYVLMACISVVIIESIAVRLATADGSLIRTNWSLIQLFIGLGFFAVCHVVAFALLFKSNSDTGLLAIFLHPIQSWSLVLRELPKRQWVCHFGFSGLVAAAMSVLVIGGLPYERLLDWGVKAPPKKSLMAAVMNQAQNMAGESDKTLEESIADFAGEAGDQKEKKKKPKPEPKPEERFEEDCIVLGYQTTSDGLIYALLIGGEHYTKLVYSGKVSLKIPVEENRQLAEDLSQIRSRKPYMKVPIDYDQAEWVRPQYIVRVSYRRKGKRGGLFDIELEELRGMAEMKSNSEEEQD